MSCNDTNGDGDCPKCSNDYFYGFVAGLFRSNFDGYYLKYDGKWYLWTKKWVCLNDKWPAVFESEKGLTTQSNQSTLTSELTIVQQGCFNPEEYRMEMKLVKKDE